MARRRIEINVSTQTLQLWECGRMVDCWRCSTAAAGVGFEEGSNRTPLGWFVIAEKIGAESPMGTRFISRQPVGMYDPGEAVEDAILTRILRLDGKQAVNVNTLQRYIYIHGTNAERHLGRQKSHGCIRMSNSDVVSLFDMVDIGTDVWISE